MQGTRVVFDVKTGKQTIETYDYVYTPPVMTEGVDIQKMAKALVDKGILASTDVR